jgi:hypothetical protein
VRFCIFSAKISLPSTTLAHLYCRVVLTREHTQARKNRASGDHLGDHLGRSTKLTKMLGSKPKSGNFIIFDIFIELTSLVRHVAPWHTLPCQLVLTASMLTVLFDMRRSDRTLVQRCNDNNRCSDDDARVFQEICDQMNTNAKQAEAKC